MFTNYQNFIKKAKNNQILGKNFLDISHPQEMLQVISYINNCDNFFQEGVDVRLIFWDGYFGTTAIKLPRTKNNFLYDFLKVIKSYHLINIIYIHSESIVNIHIRIYDKGLHFYDYKPKRNINKAFNNYCKKPSIKKLSKINRIITFYYNDFIFRGNALDIKNINKIFKSAIISVFDYDSVRFK